MARAKLPASGSDRDLLRRHLKRADVWRLLFLHIHGTINTAETLDRLDAVKVRMDPGQFNQLVALAFEEARQVGKGPSK